MASRNCKKVFITRNWYRKCLKNEIQSGEKFLEDCTERIVDQVNLCIESLNRYTENVERLGDEYATFLEESEDVSVETVINNDLDLRDEAWRCMQKLKVHREKLIQKSLSDRQKTGKVTKASSRQSDRRLPSSSESSTDSGSSTDYQSSPDRQKTGRVTKTSSRQSDSRLPSSSESSTNAGSSTDYRSSSYWQKIGRESKTIHLNGPINSDAIQGLLSKLKLTDRDRQMINQSRCEVSREWNVFLENATVKITLDDKDIVLVSGSGTNKLIVQRDGHNNIQCDWEETGFGMKFRSGAKTVGEHLSSFFTYAASFAGSMVVFKAIGR